jgi:CRP-like cAMP-binding protein
MTKAPAPSVLSPAMLRQVALFQPLQEADAQRVCTLFRPRTFRAGEVIFHHEDPGGCLYLIHSGRVRIYLPNPDGREVTLRLYGKGEVFGELSLLDGGTRTASAQAHEDTHAYLLFRDDFLRLLRDQFELVQHVIHLLVERLRYTTHYTQQLAFMSLPSRIAAALLQLTSAESSTGGAAESSLIKITQQDLAGYVGTTREWVNRTLNDFATRGWIKLQRGGVLILSRDALRLSVAQ